MRDISLCGLLFVAMCAVASEWTGFGDVKLGAALRNVHGLELQTQTEDVKRYVRPVDQRLLNALGLSGVIYEFQGGQLTAIELATAHAASTARFEEGIRKSWGKPFGMFAGAMVWLGESNALRMRRAEDGTSIIRLAPRNGVSVAGNESASSGVSDFGQDAEDEMRRLVQDVNAGYECNEGPYRWDYTLSERGSQCRAANGRAAPEKCCS